MQSGLGGITGSLRELIRTDELGAILVHLNDTYLIEERLPGIPGYARIARLTRWLRHMSLKYLNEDRVLVVHSGDFLSPSYISNTLGFKGRQMVELFNCCPVDYATLGNHEFEFGKAVLATRLGEGMFRTVLSNLRPPADFPACDDLALWPANEPFLALMGIAGSATTKAACAQGFVEIPLAECVTDSLERIEDDPRIGALVVLSHMDRDEDHDLRDILEAHWHKPGMVYILGGHDHDISWIERASKTAFSKNLANGRSVGVGFLRKSAIASPELSGDLRDDRPPEFEFEIASNPDTPTSDRSKQDIVENTIEKVRRRSAGKRTDFVRAYERLIHEVADDLGPAFLQRSDHIGQSTFDLVSMASESYAVWPFRTESLALSAEGSISELKVDPRAQEAINRWLIHRDKAVKNRPSAPVTDFSSVASGRMDAREESLRTRSTDFGNFVSDCVQKATRTDIALINSGSFRLDADIDPRITYQTLLDTFLYDRPGAIKVISLSENELGEWLAHSRRSAGSGGFLQISARRGRRSDRDRPLRVAVVAFLVSAKSDDGYLEVLAEVRRCSAKKASASFTSIQPRPESLVEMIAAGAPHVRYCNEPRTVGSEPSASDSITTEGSAIATRIDAYLDACQAAGMSRADSEHALKPLAIGPTEAMAVDAWQALRDSVRRSIADHGNGPHAAKLCRHLSRCRRAYESKIDYGRLLSYVWEDVAYTR